MNLATGEELDPAQFPQLTTISSAFFYQFTPVAKDPAPPEIIFVPTNEQARFETIGALASWNYLWEAAQFRKDGFDESEFKDSIPGFAALIEKLPAANAYLVPETKTKYDAYAPLYHLLPKRLLDRHGLPSLKRAVWPTNGVGLRKEKLLPADFQRRLSRAFAEHVWHYIDSGSGIKAFDPSDPLVLLSHSLDFWLPSAITVMEGLMRDFPRVDTETSEQRDILDHARLDAPPEISLERPRKGGSLWVGEEEAACVTEEIVNTADRSGQLRGLIDAVKSNRVVDDFSPCWSFAREDFERKLYSKRSKVRVSFVELNDTLPVHSPRSEYTDNLLWQDFSALLDKRERHIVVCLRNGTTNLGDIGTSLGYANHSPISKALVRIRKKALEFLSRN